MRREWQMSKKSKNRYISHNDLDRADKPNQDGSVASAESAGPAGAESSVASALEAAQAFVETAEVLNKGEGATLEDALAQNQAAASATVESAASDQEAELAASLAAAEATAQGAPEPIASGASAPVAPELDAAGAATAGAVAPELAPQGEPAQEAGEPAILHSSRALEDDPAVKAAQVLARDQAEELALREAEDAEEVRRTAKENVAIPPLKPVDNIENLKTAGQVLRYHRQRSGMSIKEVAIALKALPSTIANIESDLLNTPNVQQKVGRIVVLYASLLGLNPEEVFDLYLQGIKEDVIIEHVSVPRKRTDRRMNRIWLIVVLMIVVAIAGYFVFGGKEEPASSQGSLNEAALDASHDTSAALVTSDSKLTVGNNEPVVIEEEPAADAPKVMVVDENTAKATEQQYDLQQMQAQAAAAQQPVPQPEALLLPEGVAHDDQIAPVEEVATVDINPAAPEVEDKAVLAPARPNNVEPVVTPEPVAQKPAVPEPAAHKPAAPAEAENPAAVEEPAKPELASSLKNISSAVKVVGRDGLASLNRAEIAITAPVALEVTDGSGKTVRSGVFDAGDVVKITAIPPIVVKLSDTSAVKISYMGGTIALPAGEQVRFELPQR